MISVLLYSQDQEQMTEAMAEQLEILGFQVETSNKINIPRLLLNRYNVIHIISKKLPLSLNEWININAAKTLGKSVILSVLDAPAGFELKSAKWIHPHAITVGQTNHLKLFRNKNIPKMILPKVFKATTARTRPQNQQRALFFPLQNSLTELQNLKTDRTVYCDGRKLLKMKSSSTLRKEWLNLIQQNKLGTNFQLVLSDEKVKSLFLESSLAVVVASPDMPHSEFSSWVRLGFQNQQLIVLNQFQATGFSAHWTSGQNSLVISEHDWLKDINLLAEQSEFDKIQPSTELKQTAIDTLFNELSRLYTKIIYQKTSLLESDSAKM